MTEISDSQELNQHYLTPARRDLIEEENAREPGSWSSARLTWLLEHAEAMDERIDALVKWVVSTGFPFDWTTEQRPPEWFIDAMAEDRWRIDANGDLTVAHYRDSIEDETGWEPLAADQEPTR